MAELSTEFRLCFVSTRQEGAGQSNLTLVQECVRQGVGLIQYSRCGLPTADMVDEATALVRVCREEGAKLIVSGRVDVALAATADGVYLQGGDMPVALARRLLGPSALIGVRICQPGQSREAQKQGASYVAVEAPAVESPLAEFVKATTLPVCCLNLHSPQNARQAAQSGVQILAFSAALEEAVNPLETLAQFTRLLSAP
jgi:thiamine-phosphate diphosphorylase